VKTWLKIILLSALTVGISAYSLHTISSDCHRVSAPLQQLEQALLAADWEQAGSLYAEAERLWQQPQRIWPLLIDHEDSLDIEISFVDLETALQLRDADAARQELAALLYHIDHVYRHERINWQNVL